jgi:BirA family biotin operon repressor/biotin-[acetyl-CoA-carboxylase] ligase
LDTGFKTRLIILDKVDSTQNRLREMAARGEPEGAALMAIEQTKGRGSGNRDWHSPAGKNLAFSLLLRPSMELKIAPLLGLMCSVAIAEAIDQYCPARAQVKWPNDVIVGNRKMAGVLSEAEIRGRELDFVIMGVGININTGPGDLPSNIRSPATSLYMESGRIVEIKEVALVTLEKISAHYHNLARCGPQGIRDAWKRRWAHKGMRVTRENVTGTALGIDETGALLIRSCDGSVNRITSGDVNIPEKSAI